jgi:hypothetical protein
MLWQPKVHLYIHRGLLLYHIMSQTFITCLSKMTFHSILPSIHSLRWSYTVRFSVLSFRVHFLLSLASYMSQLSDLYWFLSPLTILSEYKIHLVIDLRLVNESFRMPCVVIVRYTKKKRNKLFKQSSACSSLRKHLLPQPNNMTLICTVQYH